MLRPPSLTRHRSLTRALPLARPLPANRRPPGPALLIAAPASGQGKTSVTAALARWHARQGWRVRVFKCGPDFLDPHWLELASGHPALMDTGQEFEACSL